MNLRERVRVRLARHENWFTLLWYLHLVKNEKPEGMGMTPKQAQALHDERRAADPEHDVISCWCCCWDCNFEQDEEGNVTVGPDAS